MGNIDDQYFIWLGDQLPRPRPARHKNRQVPISRKPRVLSAGVKTTRKNYELKKSM